MTSVSQHGALRLTKVDVKEGGEHAYAAKFSPDGKLFGVTFGNGVCRLFDSESLSPLQRMKALPQHDDMPATSIKWLPTTPGADGHVYEFATATSGGGIYGWSWDRQDGAFSERVWKLLEDGNETSSIDYSPDGKSIVSVGSDRKVRLYDLETRKLIDTLEKGFDETGHSRAAHTNRIFSAKFASPTTLLTGGWANPVQIWDLRTKKSERQLGGPSIGSDSIEPLEGTSKVMISSTRKENQLQVFDYISGNEIIAESEKLCKNIVGKQLYGVRYIKETQAVFAIACKPDVVVYLDAVSGDLKGEITDIGVPLHSADTVAVRPTQCLFAGAKESIYIVDIA
jgi:WD40 repeat protein